MVATPHAGETDAAAGSGTRTELVVLLDESGRATGTFDKRRVHTTDTPLHLAFSCYVFDRAGRFLLSQRALHKATWPGVWTNSCCGHPGPGEAIPDAVRRRLADELGLTDVRGPFLALPTFRYRAAMDDGTVENEMCPVYWALADGPASPSPDEVADVRWMPWAEYGDAVRSGQLAVSPWARQQLQELADLGPDPLDWDAADDGQLPPAARDAAGAAVEPSTAEPDA